MPVLCTTPGAQSSLSTKTAVSGKSISVGKRTCYPIDQLIDIFFRDRAQAFFGQEVEG